MTYTEAVMKHYDGRHWGLYGYCKEAICIEARYQETVKEHQEVKAA